jgi:hypothetical protein
LHVGKVGPVKYTLSVQFLLNVFAGSPVLWLVVQPEPAREITTPTAQTIRLPAPLVCTSNACVDMIFSANLLSNEANHFIASRGSTLP